MLKGNIHRRSGSIHLTTSMLIVLPFSFYKSTQVGIRLDARFAKISFLFGNEAGTHEQCTSILWWAKADKTW